MYASPCSQLTVKIGVVVPQQLDIQSVVFPFKNNNNSNNNNDDNNSTNNSSFVTGILFQFLNHIRDNCTEANTICDESRYVYCATEALILSLSNREHAGRHDEEDEKEINAMTVDNDQSSRLNSEELCNNDIISSEVISDPVPCDFCNKAVSFASFMNHVEQCPVAISNQVCIERIVLKDVTGVVRHHASQSLPALCGIQPNNNVSVEIALPRGAGRLFVFLPNLEKYKSRLERHGHHLLYGPMGYGWEVSGDNDAMDAIIDDLEGSTFTLRLFFTLPPLIRPSFFSTRAPALLDTHVPEAALLNESLIGALNPASLSPRVSQNCQSPCSHSIHNPVNSEVSVAKTVMITSDMLAASVDSPSNISCCEPKSLSLEEYAPQIGLISSGYIDKSFEISKFLEPVGSSDVAEPLQDSLSNHFIGEVSAPKTVKLTADMLATSIDVDPLSTMSFSELKPPSIIMDSSSDKDIHLKIKYSEKWKPLNPSLMSKRIVVSIPKECYDNPSDLVPPLYVTKFAYEMFLLENELLTHLSGKSPARDHSFGITHSAAPLDNVVHDKGMLGSFARAAPSDMTNEDFSSDLSESSMSASSHHGSGVWSMMSIDSVQWRLVYKDAQGDWTIVSCLRDIMLACKMNEGMMACDNGDGTMLNPLVLILEPSSFERFAPLNMVDSNNADVSINASSNVNVDQNIVGSKDLQLKVAMGVKTHRISFPELSLSHLSIDDLKSSLLQHFGVIDHCCIAYQDDDGDMVDLTIDSDVGELVKVHYKMLADHPGAPITFRVFVTLQNSNNGIATKLVDGWLGDSLVPLSNGDVETPKDNDLSIVGNTMQSLPPSSSVSYVVNENKDIDDDDDEVQYDVVHPPTSMEGAIAMALLKEMMKQVQEIKREVEQDSNIPVLPTGSIRDNIVYDTVNVRHSNNPREMDDDDEWDDWEGISDEEPVSIAQCVGEEVGGSSSVWMALSSNEVQTIEQENPI